MNQLINGFKPLGSYMTMQKLKTFLFILFLCFSFKCVAQESEPDTVKTGIYITSIHDIDFRDKEYTVNFWVWFNYKNPDFDFAKYIEIPQAKTMKTLYSSVDTTEDGNMYVLLKLQCVMKDSWKIDNFPFNHQSLRLTIENAQYDNSTLVFAKDTTGKIYDAHALTGYGLDSTRGWHIDPDSVKISIGTKEYDTNFGDPSVLKPEMLYSAYKVKIGIKRDAWALFWKIFIGMYIGFLIAYISFYIHIDHIDARFGLVVGALFAVVGNKYIIESSLPESSSFTLVDSLHGLTLIYILSVIVSTTYVLWLKKREEIKKANVVDMILGQFLFVVYVVLNACLITEYL
jgi:hypothetical protein